MNRPVPIFFIAVWFFLLFVSLPSQYEALIINNLSQEAVAFLKLGFLVAACVITYQLIQCNPKFLKLVFWLLIIRVTYLIVHFSVLAIQYWEVAQIHPEKFIGIGISLLCILYLAIPTNKQKLVQARSNILQAQEIKFQRKLMNGK